MAKRQTNCLDKTERRCPYLNIIMISRSSLQLIAALDAPKRGKKFVRLVWIAKLQCCGSYSALNGARTSLPFICFNCVPTVDGRLLLRQLTCIHVPEAGAPASLTLNRHLLPTRQIINDGGVKNQPISGLYFCRRNGSLPPCDLPRPRSGCAIEQVFGHRVEVTSSNDLAVVS